MRNRLRFEKLESRYFFCAPSEMDVNGDSYITPQDALVSINALNSGDSVRDSNCDDVATPSDALRIINYLNLVGSVTAQDVSVRASGGGSQMPINAVGNAWSLKIRGSGAIEFDLVAEHRDLREVISHTLPKSLIHSVQGLSDWSVVSFEDTRLGTVYRVKGSVDWTRDDGVMWPNEPYSGQQVNIVLNTQGVSTGKLRGVIVYQDWDERFRQHFTSRVNLHDVTLFSQSV